MFPATVSPQVSSGLFGLKIVTFSVKKIIGHYFIVHVKVSSSLLDFDA